MAKVTFNTQAYPGTTADNTGPFDELVHVVGVLTYDKGDVSTIDVTAHGISYSAGRARDMAVVAGEGNNPDKVFVPFIWLYTPSKTATAAARNESYERRDDPVGPFYSVITVAIRPDSGEVGARLMTLSRSEKYAESVAAEQVDGEAVINGLSWMTQTVIIQF